jgi:hypothetical protein
MLMASHSFVDVLDLLFAKFSSVFDHLYCTQISYWSSVLLWLDISFLVCNMDLDFQAPRR